MKIIKNEGSFLEFGLSLNFFRMDPLPIPKRREVVSQPRTAWRKSMCLHTKVPNPVFTSLIFQIRFLEFFLHSDVKKISCLSRGAWWIRSIRRSVSSLTKMVSIKATDLMAVFTISTSASLCSWRTLQPRALNLWPRTWMKHCLLEGLLRKTFLSLWVLSLVWKQH